MEYGLYRDDKLILLTGSRESLEILLNQMPDEECSHYSIHQVVIEVTYRKVEEKKGGD